MGSIPCESGGMGEKAKEWFEKAYALSLIQGGQE